MTEVWLTKDKRLIYVKDMTDEHLLNSQRLIKERIIDTQSNLNAAIQMSGMFQGEMALDCIERDINFLDDISSDLEYQNSVLMEEINKRKLTPKSPRERIRQTA